jgi:chaperonin GroEL
LPRPAVLFAERVSDSLVRGYDQIAELLAQTLGPTQGMVLSQREHREPEVILDAASAVRRIIEVPDRAANIGAMLMRNTTWRVHVRCGDGAAIAAVLSQALLREATRYVHAGGNAMLVKRGVERAMGAAIDALAAQAQPVTGEEALTQVAQTITGETNIALVLGEMFDVLGPAAHITVEDYAAPYLERVYFEGGRWRGALASPYLVTDPGGRRGIQENCRVVLYAGKLGTVDDVTPMLSLLAQGDNRQRPLLLVAEDITGLALNTLLTNHDRGVLKILAVILRTSGEQQADDLADLATITGAGLLGPGYGRKLSGLTPDDVGGARRAEASADDLLITGGAGDPARRRARVDGLRTQLAALGDKAEGQDRLRLRLARLAGGVGVLKVGAHTSAERQALTQKVEKAIRALRIAMVEGVVPGGGAAYLPAADAARAMAETLEGDERQGALILSRALEGPFRRIVRNRGVTVPATALAEVRRCGPGYAYDALTDRVVPASAAGVLDPAGVLRVALEAAVSGAMSALTVAVMVFHRRPSEALEP